MSKIWYKNYDEGVPQEIEIDWRRSVNEIFEDSFKKFADRPAFACMGKTITYSQLDELSRSFAGYLQKELGMKKGDRIALMMPNILQYPVALFGAFRAGLTVVNVNPLYTARELEHQLKDAGATTIVIVANFASVLQEVMDKTPLKNVIVTELGDLLGFPKKLIVNFVVKNVKKMVPAFSIPSAIPFSKALSKGAFSSMATPEIEPEDIAFLQYTGGTTGLSKGAVLTHRNITSNVAQAKSWIGGKLREGEEIIITPLPLYHIFSLTANCLTFSCIGGLNVLIPNPRDMPGFIKELNNWKFTALTGVNTLFNGLMNTPEFASVDFSSFRMTLGGGMAVQRPVAERWKEVTGVPLIEAYGLTETSPAACINPLTLEAYNGFIGLPIPSTDVSIRNDEGEEIPMGESGEICIKGPQVMRGYWNHLKETEAAFHDGGWFRTGDIGVMNEEGYFKIVDRKKDMILVSGFNVFPNEIEEVLVGHEGILECAAVGVPDPKSTEAVKVFVVKKDPSLTEADVIAYAKENLTGYKRPRFVEFRDELPKTNVGKILRRALRDQ